MKWLYLLIALLCLSGCRKETTETYMELPPVVQEELSEEPENSPAASQEDPFAIQDYFGVHTVSPAQAAPCELIWNDGNTCIFSTKTEFLMFVEKLEMQYDWEVLLTQQYAEFSFRDMEADGTPRDRFSNFLLYERDGQMILTNQTVEMETGDGISLRVRIPVKELKTLPDPELWRDSFDRLELEAHRNPDFLGVQRTPLEQVRLNHTDYVLLYPQGPILYDFIYDADIGRYTIAIEKYEPMNLHFANSVEEAILLTIQSVQVPQPEKEVLGISMTPLYLELEFNDPKALQDYNYMADASFLKVEYDDLGFTMEEAAEALGNLSLPFLTTVRSEYWPLEDLEPLRHFSSLKKIWVSNTFHRDENGILCDISAVAELQELQCFAADDYRISDLSPLGMCPQLSYVSLRDNVVEDVTPLGSCTDLEAVYLRGNLIRDASILMRMVSREEDGIHRLDLSDNPLEVIAEMNLAEASGGFVVDMDIRLEGTQFSDRSYNWNLRD